MDPGQKNYVGSLHELANSKGWVVDFREETAGPDHIRTFTMSVVMNGKVYPEGSGQKKKEARQNAAKNALASLENEELVNSETNLEPSASFSPVTQANYVCWLNEHSHKKRVLFIPKESSEMKLASNSQICSYACKYVCGEKEFPEGTGKSKKEAKEAAAKLVYEILKNQALEENGNGEENLSLQSLSLHHQQPSTTTDAENTTDTNFIGLLNQYCQKFNQVYDFKAVDKRGPAHVPEFIYRVVLNKKEYPEGRGRTKQEAKQKAAQLALTELKDSNLSSQSSSLSLMSESSDDVSSVPDLHVKPKRQLAANFQYSPVSNKKQSNINVLKIPNTSTTNQTPQQPNSPSVKSQFLEMFDSISRLGKGGYGRVFKARGKVDKKFYAVKIVKKTEKACREVTALSRLSHVNIVRYHTSWIEETEYRDETSDTSSSSSSGSGSAFLYIQMEFCEGETLYKWIEERNDHPEKYPKRRWDAGKILKQVLEAVSFIHLNKLFHRDMKPLNIMFGHKGEVKVGDFGLVSKEERDDDGHPLERTQKVGTRSYMSPEQRRYQKDYDRKVDIYAVGLIYFELLWRFGTVSERQRQWSNIQSKNFPKEFSITFDFEHKLIEGMLCENPVERPEASELLTKLVQHSDTRASKKHNKHNENRTY